MPELPVPVPPSLTRDRLKPTGPTQRVLRRSTTATFGATVTQKQALAPRVAVITENSEERADSPTPMTPPVMISTKHSPAKAANNNKEPGDAGTTAAKLQSALFPSAPKKKQDRSEQTTMLMSLQQNIRALTVLNRQQQFEVKALKKTIEELTNQLHKTKEELEEEKVKNEKITAIKKSRYANDGSATYLPEVYNQNASAAAAAAAAAALQQQTQLEISYQRKLLSLENRYKDVIANNKKLVTKIQQLEQTEADADAVIKELRQENVRLATQVDALSSTITSQSSLIIGLRTSLQQQHEHDDDAGLLQKRLLKLQSELDSIKTREKVLKDDYEKTKTVFAKEKEAFMNRILDFQHQLQLKEHVGDDVEALQKTVQSLQLEKLALESEVESVQEAHDHIEAALQEQAQLTNRLQEEKEALEGDVKMLQAQLAAKDQELQAKAAAEAKLVEESTSDKEIAELMKRIVQLEEERDDLVQGNAKIQHNLEQAQRQLDLAPVQQIPLSQDETVQALQLARQKAATHEALALVNEEKQALEARLTELQQQYETERWHLIKDHTKAEEAYRSRIDQLEKEVAKDRPPLIVHVEKLVPTDDSAARTKLENDLSTLKMEYEDLKQAYDALELEYKKLATKKYKTESFQSQVKLLQNENSELSTKLADVCAELTKAQSDLKDKTMEIVDLKARAMDAIVFELLKKTQESLEHTVMVLVEAETASESSFTCLRCLRLFVDPMTLTPCGHTYCASCLASLGNPDLPESIVCKECEMPASHTESIFPNQALADLTARFIFRQQSLSSLTTMCLSLRNHFTQRK